MSSLTPLVLLVSQIRLQLPCTTFSVRWRPGQDGDRSLSIIYDVKAYSLQDLLITTENKVVEFSPRGHIHQTCLFICPWNCYSLKLPGFDDLESLDSTYMVESVNDWPELETPSESYMRGSRLTLIVHLGQPFGVLLLGWKYGRGARRIAI
jgi:hypothetical protein